MSDLTFEVTEFFQDKEMRFRAALAFATTHEGKHIGCPSIDDAIKMADDLIAKLNETAE
jgi:hypothetical protein